MASLNVSDASRMAGVSIESMVEKINRGELEQTEHGIDVSELIREYPNLKPLAALKIRKVKKHRANTTSMSSEAVDVVLGDGDGDGDGDTSQVRNDYLNNSDKALKDGLTLELPQTHGRPVLKATNTTAAHAAPSDSNSLSQHGTVELLVRELEWNKELLEHTNQLMAKQLADQRSLIADQARRLDEKDRFWARQIEIAQSLLPAPQSVVAPRKKIFGIF